MVGGQQPYVAENGGVKTGSQKGLGHSGDKSLIYHAEKGKAPADLPTAEGFDHFELFPKVRETLKQNPALIESLVRDLKRHGFLGILVGELASYNETFEHLAEIMASDKYGQDVCKKLVRAMHEDVAPPFHKAAHQQLGMMDPNMGDPNADPSMDPSMDPNMGLGGDDMGMGMDPAGGMGPDGAPITGHEEDDMADDDDDFDDDGLDDDDSDPNDDASLGVEDDPMGAGLNDQDPTDAGLPPSHPHMNPLQQKRPLHAPAPQTMPPAMENLRRAFAQISEGYRPIKRKK